MLHLSTATNSGQAVARNLGLDAAEGELTLMVDADDWLAPDCLAQVWEAYRRTDDTDSVILRLVKVWSDGREEEFQLPPATTLSGAEACHMSVDWTVHGVYAVRTTLHRRYPYDTTCRLYSDDNTSRLHYLHSRRVAISEGTYYYRQHPAGSTVQTTRRRFDFLTANDSLRATLEAEGVDTATLATCEDYIWRIYVGLWREYHGTHCSLTPDERREVRQMLRSAYHAVRYRRIPRITRLRPCYLTFGGCYPIFTLWQRLLMMRH